MAVEGRGGGTTRAGGVIAAAARTRSDTGRSARGDSDRVGRARALAGGAKPGLGLRRRWFGRKAVGDRQPRAPPVVPRRNAKTRCGARPRVAHVKLGAGIAE